MCSVIVLKTSVNSAQIWKKTPTEKGFVNFSLQNLTGHVRCKFNLFFCLCQMKSTFSISSQSISATVLEKMRLDPDLSCSHSTLIIQHPLDQYSLHPPPPRSHLYETKYRVILIAPFNKYMILEDITICLPHLLKRKWLNFSRREVVSFKIVFIQCTVKPGLYKLPRKAVFDSSLRIKNVSL